MSVLIFSIMMENNLDYRITMQPVCANYAAGFFLNTRQIKKKQFRILIEKCGQSAQCARNAPSVRSHLYIVWSTCYQITQDAF